MKKLLLIILCIATLCVSASAHGGRTDENGGHTDSSTGEYHYHHGYPAHQHWDMDGDGKNDCPYEFDDKTEHSKKDSSSSTDNVTKADEVPNRTDKEENQKTKTWASAKKIVKNVFTGIFIVAGSITILYVVYFFALILIEAVQNLFKKKR